jgi:uncharacterized phage protein gp47/JayE
MAYNKKSIAELTEQIKQQIGAELGLDVALITDASMVNILAKVQAGTVSELYADLEYLTRQAFPTTAGEEGLRIWGAIKEVEWRTSLISAGIVEATGTNGSAIDTGTELTDDNGNIFVTVGGHIISGVTDVTVESQLGGADKNLDAGAVLTFVSTPIGVVSTTTVNVDGLTGGADAWTLEEYREAVLANFAAPPRGGSDNDYVYWTKQTVNATDVWVYSFATHPADIIAGDVEVYFTMVDEYPLYGLHSGGESELVRNYIDTVRPVGMGNLSTPDLISQNVGYEIILSPNGDSELEAAVEASLVSLHNETAPGGTITTGQMNRAISDTAGVVDFTLVLPAASVSAVNRGDKLVITNPITWS